MRDDLMLPHRFRYYLALSLLLIVSASALAQTRPRSQNTNSKPRTEKIPETDTTAEPEISTEVQNIETLKTDTNLVSVPVIATDQRGSYIPDLDQEEFTILEDGVKQQVAFFGKVATPFHVVLMIDTSGSTQEKLRVIQQAACAFLDQLRPADRVKVISFDDEVRDRNEFTSDRSTLQSAINGTRPGKGTKLYDALDLALNAIRTIKGRRAIVVFTDGVDWHSDRATFDTTAHWIDEDGVIIYPIRYDTRAETERLAREQANEIEPTLPTLDVIRRTPPGSTPTTFPSDDPGSGPPAGSRPTSGPLGLPLPAEILRRRREPDPNRDPTRDPGRERLPSDITLPPESRGSRLPPTSSRGERTGSRSDDSISSMLDLAYETADLYLSTLANKTGGKLLRADSLGSLPDAFSKIAAELRTQYVLGYYPLNKVRDDRYRTIKVTTTRDNVIIRARPGYLATNSQ